MEAPPAAGGSLMEEARALFTIHLVSRFLGSPSLNLRREPFVMHGGDAVN